MSPNAAPDAGVAAGVALAGTGDGVTGAGDAEGGDAEGSSATSVPDLDIIDCADPEEVEEVVAFGW